MAHRIWAVRLDKVPLSDSEVAEIRRRYSHPDVTLTMVARAVGRSVRIVSEVVGCKDSADAVMAKLSLKARKGGAYEGKCVSRACVS